MTKGMIAFTNISEFDLQDEDIQECIEVLGLDEVLYQIGFDKEYSSSENTHGFYEVVECNHVTRSGKKVFGKLYISRERTDVAWLQSGLCSEEAKMAAKKDISYVQCIREICKRSY